MRLFLFNLVFVSTAVLVLTCLPVVLARLLDRFVPWSLTGWLWRAFAWACAHSMRWSTRRLTWLGRRARWDWAYDLAERLSPYQLHVTSVALHTVCTPCAEEAPGWWDFTLDCAGHECRRCDVCIHAYVGSAPFEDTCPDRHLSF